MSSGTTSTSPGTGEQYTTLALDRREIRALTGLRLFAAAWVVLFHFEFTHGVVLAQALAPAFPVVTTGAMGVDLFFVLSGFVIAFTYLDRLGEGFSARAAGRFLWARVGRIWPAYALVTTLFGGFLLFKRWYWSSLEPAYQNVQPDLSLGSWLRQLTLTQLWSNPWHDGVSFVGPAWSVSAEFLAYATFPLTALVLYRLGPAVGPGRPRGPDAGRPRGSDASGRPADAGGRPGWVLGAGAIVLMVPESLLCLTTGSPYFPYSWLVRIGGGFLAGVLAYLAVRDIPRSPRVQRTASLVAGGLLVLVLAGLVLGWWLGPGPDGVSTERGGVVLLLFPPLVGALALASGRLTRALSRPVVVHGGRISYSLYLVHVPVFEVWWALMERVGVLHDNGLVSDILTPLVFAGVFVLAHLLYTRVEEPARRLLRPRRP